MARDFKNRESGGGEDMKIQPYIRVAVFTLATVCIVLPMGYLASHEEKIMIISLLVSYWFFFILICEGMVKERSLRLKGNQRRKHRKSESR